MTNVTGAMAEFGLKGEKLPLWALFALAALDPGFAGWHGGQRANRVLIQL